MRHVINNKSIMAVAPDNHILSLPTVPEAPVKAYLPFGFSDEEQYESMDLLFAAML